MDKLDLVQEAFDYLSDGARCHGLQAIVKKSDVKGRLIDGDECDAEHFSHYYSDVQCYWEDDFSGLVYMPLSDDKYGVFLLTSH